MKSSGRKGTKTDAKKGITRRKLLKYMAVSGPLLKAGMGLKASASKPGPATNVILFPTDQERKIQHFPADWESQNLPGLARLKQHGVSFENAFTNACMCSPARSTLMSGYFPARHGVKYTLEDNMIDLLRAKSRVRRDKEGLFPKIHPCRQCTSAQHSDTPRRRPCGVLADCGAQPHVHEGEYLISFI